LIWKLFSNKVIFSDLPRDPFQPFALACLLKSSRLIHKTNKNVEKDFS